MYVVSAQQMRDLDRYTIEQIGIPGLVLMENAGAAVVKEIQQRWAKGKVVILSGYGNNGGDGLVISRHLQNEGRQVSTWVFGKEENMSKDCLAQLHILQASSYSVHDWNDLKIQELQQDIRDADVIVDALLGTGVKGPLRTPYSSVIQLLREVKGKVVAVDIPSGVNADNGEVATLAVKADLTVTFAFPKWGHFLYPGANHRGELVVANISIPQEATRYFSLQDALLIPEKVAKDIPLRPRFSNKGTYGRVLMVAGSREMTGAPVLAALSGLRAGCGLLTLAVPENLLPIVESKINEAVFLGLPASNNFFSLESSDMLKERMANFDIIAIGPGIGTWAEGNTWLNAILSECDIPLLLDADALNLLAANREILRNKKGPIILTPHPGEMARLCHCSVKEVEGNRRSIARQMAIEYGVSVVLKGTYTVLATPEGKTFLNTRGSSALAKGGSGDVLTGMIAGIVAQKKEILPSLQLSLVLHGLAGEICGKRSQYSTLAGDVSRAIGEAYEELHVLANSKCTTFPGD